jgi:hypothetical protein
MGWRNDGTPYSLGPIAEVVHVGSTVWISVQLKHDMPPAPHHAGAHITYGSPTQVNLKSLHINKPAGLTFGGKS